MDLAGFLNSDAGLALKGALVAAFLDFATGTFAAIKDDTFTFDALAAFLRKHVLGRVAPLGTMLALGYFGGPAGAAILPFAIAGLAAYAAETISSVKGNLLPPKEGDVKLTEQEKAAGVQVISTPVNPVPED